MLTPPLVLPRRKLVTDAGYNAVLAKRCGAPLPTRLLLGLLALVLAGLYASWLDTAQPAEIRSAVRLAGERWYRLLMEDRHIGYVHTRSWRDGGGGWRFETLTQFSLNGEAPVSISDRLHFHNAPPYALAAAEHWTRRSGAEPSGVIVTANGDGLSAAFVRGARTDAHPADWDYGLSDYLGLETWLAQQRPQPGERFTARMPDFDRGEPVNRTFRILEKTITGYLIESPAPLRATTIQLDRRLAPVELSMAGIFVVARASRADALAARTPLHLTDFRIPLDRRLEEPAKIEHLRLTGGTGLDLRRIWPQARRRGGEWLIELTPNPISRHDDPAGALAETLSYPISHPQITDLARQAVGDSTDAPTRLARLVTFVHDYIAYRPQGPQRTVLETIAERSGDCTEYASLLTTLARSAGLPARTVMGLAYSERSGATLAFHAWNEVAVNGTWQAVDPTWNQLRADATHIPMPDNQAALLHSMQGRNPLAFRIDEVGYSAGF